MHNYISTDSGSKHYPDYSYSQYRSTLSILKDGHYISPRIHIGSTPKCICCSCEIDDTGELLCDDCLHIETCYNCDNRVNEDDVIWIGDLPYCSSCVQCCDYCDEYTASSLTTVGDIDGTIDVCDNCLDRHTSACICCGEVFLNSALTDGVCPGCLEEEDESDEA